MISLYHSTNDIGTMNYYLNTHMISGGMNGGYEGSRWPGALHHPSNHHDSARIQSLFYRQLPTQDRRFPGGPGQRQWVGMG